MAGRVVAVVDSGINPGHPHIGSVVGGVWLRADGSEDADWVDRIGHGTAVAAAIHEKAPEAEFLAVRVFDRTLATSVEVLARAIAWSAEHGARFINLSLGTSNPAHADALRGALTAATRLGATVVSAAQHDGVVWYPGSLDGAVGVILDWDCRRDKIRQVASDGQQLFAASGYPRPIPGVEPDRNLKGISFAVANVTGYLAASS